MRTTEAAAIRAEPCRLGAGQLQAGGGPGSRKRVKAARLQAGPIVCCCNLGRHPTDV
jgi:hypothetical protein